MIRHCCLCLLLALSATCTAQFNTTNEITVADTLRIKSLEWIDVDNDSLLDLLTIAKIPDSTYSFLLFKNSVTNEFSFASGITTTFNSLTYFLTDYDMDNSIDIVVSGASTGGGTTNVLINNGNFQFELMPEEILPVAATMLSMTDLNLDGRKELVLSGGDVGEQLTIYRKTTSGWIIANDSIKLLTTSFIAADFDGDLRQDIFLSGEKAGENYTAVLYNRGEFFFTDTLLISGLTSPAGFKDDFNHDGMPDIFIAGHLRSKFLLSTGAGGFIQRDTLTDLFIRNTFTGDLNSDGETDLNLMGTNAAMQPINLIHYSSGESLTLEPAAYQRFGDADRDGDLDLAQVKDQVIKFFMNETITPNSHPGKVSSPFAAILFDRLFAFWERTGDDHTPLTAITYDITLWSQGEEMITGDFDLLNKRRMLVSAGNNGSHHFTLLKNIPLAPFDLYVQSVDNAYHAGAYGKCQGNGQPCTDLNTVTITKCGAESVPLSHDNAEALWFSFRDGYLGTFTEYPHEKTLSDTVFAFVPGETPSCASLKVFLIDHAGELLKKESFTKYVCEEEQLTFTVEPDWPAIHWSSSLLGNISDEHEINYVASVQDTVRVELTDQSGCTVQRETVIMISKPELHVQNETYQILQGESVQLLASGGEKYLWQPSTDLNDPTTSSPVAAPKTTTEYLVTAYDSLDCAAHAKVLVIVEQTAFIPNLFTPNEDGKNDVLKVYGLTQAKDFSLFIYNREGSIVYKTSDVQEATARGWNGMVGGVLQPAGVYHWKVQGEYSGGKPLLLNGKETGSIVLIR